MGSEMCIRDRYICVRCGTGAEVVLQNCCRIILPGNNAAEPVQNHALVNAAEPVQNHPLANAAESVQNHLYYTIYIYVCCSTGAEVVLQNCCRIILPGIDAAEPVQNLPLVNAAEPVQNHSLANAAESVQNHSSWNRCCRSVAESFWI